MRRLYFALLSLAIVSSVLKAQTKTVIPRADSVKKIGKTGETCLPCAAAAKAAVKPKQVTKKPVKKPVAKKIEVEVNRTMEGKVNFSPVVPASQKPKEDMDIDGKYIDVVPRAALKAAQDSLRECEAREKKLRDSLSSAEKLVAQLRDSLLKRVSLPKIWIDTVYKTHTSKKALVTTALVSGAAGFAGGYFSHKTTNIATATIIRNNMFLSPDEQRLRAGQSAGIRFTLPIGK